MFNFSILIHKCIRSFYTTPRQSCRITTIACFRAPLSSSYPLPLLFPTHRHTFTFHTNYGYLTHFLPATTHTARPVHLKPRTCYKETRAHHPAIISRPDSTYFLGIGLRFITKCPASIQSTILPIRQRSLVPPQSATSVPVPICTIHALSLHLPAHRLLRVHTHGLAQQHAPKLVLTKPQLNPILNSPSL